MLEIIEIQHQTLKGQTKPFLCQAEDGKTYFVKGKSASYAERVREWLCANIARSFRFKMPSSKIVYISDMLIEAEGALAIHALGSGYAFASENVMGAKELEYSLLPLISDEIKQDIFIFDCWIRNSDRTLTTKGGNPNLLWSAVNQDLYVIDHNLSFEPETDVTTLLETHVFADQFHTVYSDMLLRQYYENVMQDTLKNWSEFCDSLPYEWVDSITESGLLNLDNEFQRLKEDASGALWARLLK